ncbi:TPA: conjugal transfer mating-pair stabilization protein TraG, partial [Klebsiella michiganensis]
QNMPGVSGSGGHNTVTSDYAQHSGSIDAMTKDAGIKDNVVQTVDNMVSQNKQAHQDAHQGIQHQGDDVKGQHTDLKNNHKSEGNKMENEYNGKKDEQKSLPGADTRDELLNKARDYQEKHKP